MLDRDLARLYQVEVKVLNQAVKRNLSRFPADFMFQLTAVEAGSLRTQSVTFDGVEAAVGRQNLEAGSPAGATRASRVYITWHRSAAPDPRSR